MMAKLALRGLAAHKLRLGLTSLAVILSVGFVSGTMILSATMDKSIGGVFAEIGEGTDTVVRTKQAFATELGTDAPDKPVPSSVLDSVRDLPGVEKARGVANGYAAPVDKSGKVFGSPPQTGVDWNDDADVSPMSLKEGRGPRTAGEVAIDARTAKKTGYEVGDKIKIVLGDGTRTFTLAGVFRYGESEDLSSTVVTAFEPETAQRLLMERPDSYREIDLHAEDGVSQSELTETVTKALPGGYEAITGQKAIDEKTEAVKDILGLLQNFVLVFAGVAVFVGSFIIFNTFSMLVAQRMRELALLRAVGASRSQVTLMVMGEALGIGFVGSTLGLALGGGLGLGLRWLFSTLDLGIPASQLTFPVSAVVWSYAVGMLVTLVGAYLPARRASKVAPVAAMRTELAPTDRSLKFRAVAGTATMAAGAVGMAVGFTGTGTAALTLAGGGAGVFFIGITTLSPIISKPVTRALGWPFARLFGATGRIGRENAQRNPRRTAATASALMIGLTLISGVSVIASSMIASTNKQIDSGLTSDYRVDAPSSQSPLSADVQRALARTPGVEEAVASQDARFRLDGKVSKAAAGDPAQLVKLYKLKLESGDTALGRDELLISHQTAVDQGWQTGDRLEGEYQDGSPATFRIGGIYTDVKTVLETVPTLILGMNSYREHYSADQIGTVDIIKSPGADAAATEKALETTLQPWPNVDLKNRDAIKKQYTSSIDLLLRMVLVLLALSITIAALGILNTLALSVVERTREIGLLRAIGMQRRQVRQMIRYESVVISTFGAVLGLAVGVVLAWSIQNAAAAEGMKVLSIPVAQLGLYVLTAALIGVVAALWPARRASNMDVLDAIATNE
ncbi:ABC transporter permease [Streptomyces armeniacus]|uniref:ABC transporter permease n=1 Tax=Streptomyces armeniacus TaxID=83291 RepID=A0A345XNZ7_9ACTN|nr:ABC transporter permease [Streptomyces armeniacus]AXK33363.1 ABC transporter permease [Streptomyces armeniacus]